MLRKMLVVCLLLLSQKALAYDSWSQNKTWFVVLSPQETYRLQWSTVLPEKKVKVVVSGTYFNPVGGGLVVLIKRWDRLFFDQPKNLPPRPALFLPLNERPYITYNRNSMGRWLIGGGPLLVNRGMIDVRLKMEGFKSDVRASRRFSAIGVRPDGKLVIVVTRNRSLKEIAWCFVYLGCERAIRLDGGSSTYLEIEGNVVVGSKECSNYFYLPG